MNTEKLKNWAGQREEKKAEKAQLGFHKVYEKGLTLAGGEEGDNFFSIKSSICRMEGA